MIFGIAPNLKNSFITINGKEINGVIFSFETDDGYTKVSKFVEIGKLAPFFKETEIDFRMENKPESCIQTRFIKCSFKDVNSEVFGINMFSSSFIFDFSIIVNEEGTIFPENKWSSSEIIDGITITLTGVIY